MNVRKQIIVTMTKPAFTSDQTTDAKQSAIIYV
jgi:hypothetical protein